MIAPHPFLTNRGSPLNVYKKAKTLSELGHNLILLTYPEGVNIPDLKIIRVPFIPFLRNIPIGPSIHKFLYDILLLLYGLIIILRNRFDVIHAHEIDGAIIGSLLKNICIMILKYKPLLYYDMHSLFFEQMQIRGYKNIFIKSLSKYIEKYAYYNSDKLLIISPFFKTRLSEFNQNHKSIFIPDVPALKEEKINQKLFKKLKNKIKADKIFFYMGTLEYYQGLNLLIHAFKIVEKKYNNVVLLIVGGSKKDSENLKKYIKKINLKRVYIYNQQPLEMMPVYLKFSDIVISPRLYGTNIPYKIYPYIRMGKPLIATNIPAHNIILEDSKNALMCEVNSIDMAKKMLLLMEDHSLEDRIAKGARELFIRLFTFESYKNKLKNLYYLRAGENNL